jgi:cytoskeletal protein CcmA (bactofilin family)
MLDVRHDAAAVDWAVPRQPRTSRSNAMLWKKNGNATAKANSDLSAYIDEASEIEGKYTFSGTVMLNGKLSGEITTKDTLIIGEKGVVHACIRAGIVLVNGEVVGNIFGTERVELRGSARVVGDVEAPVVVVEEGVVFEGHCRMTKPSPSDAFTAKPQRDLSVVSLEP